jgi:hypothetical protein
MSDADRAYAEAEARLGMGGVLAALGCRWVNHPHHIARAPINLCSWLPRDAVVWPCRTPWSPTRRTPCEFAATGETVMKFFGSNTILEQGVRKISFTRLVTDTDLADLRGINVTTHQLQRWVPKLADVRVVVVGEHITAVAIHAGSSEAYVDFRADYGNVGYKLIDTPDEVRHGIRRLMTELGLGYGALDFVIDKDTSQWVFLEINAGGQFGFVEDATGAPLTA